ncbi:phosphate ABC transporter permease PstA [Candidatus Bipolaricaulota bacterium]|nr:phosphate ABC transporter permease PstA [Candidatus Bipolaricaulota bacterium]
MTGPAQIVKRRTTAQRVAFSLLTLASLLSFLALGAILYTVFRKGVSAISWEFLTKMPKSGMTQGGIYPMVLGSFYLTAGALISALPFGVISAIWLSEYAGGGWWVRTIRIGVNTLAGVPSIVFGLLGFAFFVNVLGLGASLLSGAFTLGILILPILIRAAEEALRSVPNEFREAALALGATQWRSVRTVVLPSAIPGIMTGAILGIGRAIGETAPILFTAAAIYKTRLPDTLIDTLMSRTMALPTHIFYMATENPRGWQAVDLQFGAALLLLGLVVCLNLGAVIWRTRVRRRKQW